MTGSGSFSGRCLCGTVRFRVTPPTKWCAHCHCSLCRRAHGAGFVTWFGVVKFSFELISGANSIEWYQSTPAARRGFCARCGSTMLFESERWPNETHIALAHMDGPIDRAPQAHVFYDDHVDWITLGDDLSRRGGTTGTEELD